ncbi:MAG: tetratricopeptide repeat protein [Candidatus Cloacimonadaceae bacterium]
MQQRKVKENRNVIKRAETLLKNASEAWKSGNYSEGKTYAEAALELGIIERNLTIQAHASHILGTIYAYLDAYDLALENYLKAQRLNDKLGEKTRQAEALNSMGDIYIKLSDIPKATECFEKAHMLYPEYERCINNLGYLKMLKGELDEAIRFYRMACKISASNGSLRSEIISHINISDALCKLGKPELALEELKAADILINKGKIETPNEIRCALLLNLSYVKQMLDDDVNALSHLNDALDLSQTAQLKDYQQKSFHMLASYNAAKENWKQAYFNLMEFTNLNTQILSSNMIQKLSNLQNFYAKETRDLITMNLTEKSARLATLGILSTSITHELNQPLSAIRISSESILYWIKKESIVMPMNFNVELNHILEGIKRIENVVRIIRQFWNSGRDSVLVRCDLGLTIDKCISLVSRRMFAHGITLEYDNPAENFYLEVSEIHLQQIIINLLNHCINLLENSPAKHKILLIKTDNNKGRNLLTVMQDGSQITAEMLSRLFNPFSSEDVNNDNEMDIAIVKHLCDNYQYKLNPIQQKKQFWGFVIDFGANR